MRSFPFILADGKLNDLIGWTGPSAIVARSDGQPVLERIFSFIEQGIFSFTEYSLRPGH
jgi:hypothetical protein